MLSGMFTTQKAFERQYELGFYWKMGKIEGNSHSCHIFHEYLALKLVLVKPQRS